MRDVLQKIRKQQADCAVQAAEFERSALVLRSQETAFRLAGDAVEDELRKLEKHS